MVATAQVTAISRVSEAAGAGKAARPAAPVEEKFAAAVAHAERAAPKLPGAGGAKPAKGDTEAEADAAVAAKPLHKRKMEAGAETPVAAGVVVTAGVVGMVPVGEGVARHSDGAAARKLEVGVTARVPPEGVDAKLEAAGRPAAQGVADGAEAAVAIEPAAGPADMTVTPVAAGEAGGPVVGEVARAAPGQAVAPAQGGAAGGLAGAPGGVAATPGPADAARQGRAEGRVLAAKTAPDVAVAKAVPSAGGVMTGGAMTGAGAGTGVRVAGGAADTPGQAAGWGLAKAAGSQAPAVGVTSAPGVAAEAGGPVVVAPPPVSPGGDMGRTAAGLAAAVTAMTQAGKTSMSVKLDPPALGSMSIHLAVGDDAKVNVLLVAAVPQTAQAFAAGADDLRQALVHSGIDLGQLNVGGGKADSGSSFGAFSSGSGRDQPARPPRPVSGDAAPNSAAGVRAIA